MRRRPSLLGRLLLIALVAGGVALTFRQGLLPARYSPLPRLDLDRPTFLLVDWQLAELKSDRALCQQVLKPPHIEASPVADSPMRDGCGLANGVRLSSAGGARLPVDRIACGAAAAIALWMAHEVQPLAQVLLGQRVASVQHMGSYSCRNIAGNPFWKEMRSEHATANALDISGFTLADGRQITLLKHWSASGPEAEFLRTVHRRACRYFRVALGPDFNAAHKDHFHFDRGWMSTCR